MINAEMLDNDNIGQLSGNKKTWEKKSFWKQICYGVFGNHIKNHHKKMPKLTFFE